ncbi:MAG: hypothetical protein AB7U43_12810 [Desulfobacter sp.]
MQPAPILDLPSLAMRRQRKYHQVIAPVRPAIVSRSDSDMVQHDWYFSCGEKSIFLSGYRRYELDTAGNWFIAARWYPEVHALGNLIPIEEVPFPDDVIREAIKKGYDRAVPEGFQVVRSEQNVMVMIGTAEQGN